jgi:high-affinity nickel-transport protein
MWRSIGELNDDLANFGFVIVGIFIVAWIVSAMVYWLSGYDRISAAQPAE